MIRFSCPKCDTGLKTPDEKAGTKLLCPECGERVTVPTASTEKNGGNASKTATLPKKASPKTAAAGSSKGLFIGLAVGACVLVIGGAVLIMWMMNKDKPTQQAATSTPAPAQTPFAVNVNPTPAPAITDAPPVSLITQAPATTTPTIPSTAEKPATDTQVAVNTQSSTPRTDSFDVSAPEAKDIRNYLLGVTCWVVTYYPETGGGGSGSGSLVDRENKLVLTNHHVVAEHLKKPGRAVCFFPIYDKGKEIMEKEFYQKRVIRNEGISFHVVWHDSRKDLALIKLVEIPEGVKPIRISKKSVEPGDRVHSMGSPGRSGALWLYTYGQVRAVYNKDWLSGSSADDITRHSARIVETTSPTNAGDSGGPMVNDRKELVAVTQGGAVGGNVQLLSIFIDVSEVRTALKTYYDANKIKPPAELDAAPAGETTNVSVLVASLDDKTPAKRAEAALMLARYGADAKPAVDALVKALKDKDDIVRRNAMEALEQIGGLTQRHLAAVVERLKDSSPEVRAAAASTLRLMAGEAESAVPALQELLKNDKDAIVRRRAAAALGATGASTQTATILGAALKDESAGVRSEAAAALAKMGPKAVEVLTPISDALEDNQQDVRLNSLRALESIGADAKPAVPKIHKALQERDKDTRLAAVAAVAAIRAEDKDTVKLLVDLLAEKDNRTPVTEALVRIGKGTVPVLNRELNNPKAEVRLGCVLALEQLGADAAPALQNLGLLAQRDLNAEVRAAAVKAVTTIQKKVRGQ